MRIAKEAKNRALSEVAVAAASRGYTLRGVAEALGVHPSTVSRHLRSLNPRPETLRLWQKKLGIGASVTREMRVKDGPRALTEDDLRHYRRSLIYSAVHSECYMDPAKAAETIGAALDACRDRDRRAVLHRVALEIDEPNREPRWPVGSQSVRELCKKAGRQEPLARTRSIGDGALWMLVDALRGVGYSTDEAREVGGWITDALLRLGRVSQQTVDAWKQSLSTDRFFGEDAYRARMRAIEEKEE